MKEKFLKIHEHGAKNHEVWKGLSISYTGNLRTPCSAITSFAKAKGPQGCSPTANGTINNLKGERKQ